jgi:UDP-glucose 4-epimerase
MRLLVTGGAGYIGSVVTARLLEEGHDVTVLDDLSTGHRDAVPPAATLVEGRVHDAFDVIEAGNFEAALHFAAFSLVGESVSNPTKYEENNIVGSSLLCDALQRAGVEKVIFSSSAAVYGEPGAGLITEEAPTSPSNPYGATKLAIDRDLSRRAKESDFAAVSLRYFNVAGAFGPYGERHRQETHLIPVALEVVAGVRKQLTIYGEDFPTPDGTCVRDYIHVVDLADAHILALEALRAGRHEIINLGNGEGFSVYQVAGAVRRVTGKALPTVVGARRAGDPAMLVASNEKARAVLGWTPARPDLETMIEDAWAFLQSRSA